MVSNACEFIKLCGKNLRVHLKIFSSDNVEGENKEEFPDRAGSWVDAESLLKCFERIGFCEKVVHCNKTCAEMEETFNELARVDYSNVDCVVVAILTYGEKPDKLKGK